MGLCYDEPNKLLQSSLRSQPSPQIPVTPDLSCHPRSQPSPQIPGVTPDPRSHPRSQVSPQIPAPTSSTLLLAHFPASCSRTPISRTKDVRLYLTFYVRYSLSGALCPLTLHLVLGFLTLTLLPSHRFSLPPRLTCRQTQPPAPTSASCASEAPSFHSAAFYTSQFSVESLHPVF